MKEINQFTLLISHFLIPAAQILKIMSEKLPLKFLGRLTSFEASIVLRFLPGLYKLTKIVRLSRKWN